MKLKVKQRRVATTEIELTKTMAMEADQRTLELQLLDLVRQFTEALAPQWSCDPNQMQVTVQRDSNYERDVLVFKVTALGPEDTVELETSEQLTALTLPGLQARMAMLGFKM